jgi:hypothetical protein
VRPSQEGVGEAPLMEARGGPQPGEDRRPLVWPMWDRLSAQHLRKAGGLREILGETVPEDGAILGIRAVG